MHGKPRPRHPSAAGARPRLSGSLLLVFLLQLIVQIVAQALWLPAAPQARELRRSMPFLRPLLMGDAYVAVGDEASTLLYNPAGPARVEEGSVEGLSLQIAADEQLKRALVDDEDVRTEFDDLSLAELTDEIGTSLFFDVQVRLPFIVDPEDGSAYGIGAEVLSAVEVIADANGQPALQLETFLDQIALWSRFWQLGNLSLGGTLKVINRIGINKTLDVATLFGSGATLELENDPDFQDVQQGRSTTRAGLDLGLIYEFGGAPNWQPRVGLSVLNFGDYDSERGALGIEFSTPRVEGEPPVRGELPLNATLGFAVSPTFANVRYTLALDVVDLARTALDGDSLSNRTRVGLEIGVGPHADGTALFSVLLGWNATHFGGGILSRVWIFEIGFGQYTVEKGERPHDNPEERRLLLFAFRF